MSLPFACRWKPSSASLLATLLATLLTTIAPLARAEGARSAKLVKQAGGPADCPDGASLERAVEQRLGRRLFRQGPADLRFDVRFELADAGSGVRARVLVSDGSGRPLGERELASEAGACSDVAASVTLVLALLADSPPAWTPEPSDSTTERAVPKPAPSASATPPPRRQTPASVAGRWRYRSSVGAVLDSGWPSWVPGLRLAFGVEPPGLGELRLEAELASPAEVELESSSAGARLNAFRFGLLVCPLRSPDQRREGWAGWACLAGRVERVRAEGFGFETDRSGAGFGTLLGLRAGIDLTLAGPLGVRAGVGAAGALTRPELRYRTPAGASESLYDPDLFRFEAEVGLVFALP